MPINSAPITEQRATVEAGTGLTIDLKLPAGANLRDAIQMVWLDYWVEDRIARWRDTWRISTETADQGTLVLSQSQLTT